MSSDEIPPETGQPSVLPFAPEDLTSIRVNQSGLARLMKCSRQTVSEWVRSGKITTLPDGSINPQRAYAEYLANSDPGRMQTKMLKPVAAEIDQLRKINSALASDRAEHHRALQSALHLLAETSAWLERFMELIEAGDRLIGAGPEEWPMLVQDAFDLAGEHAMSIDPAVQLPRVDDQLGHIWQLWKPLLE